MRRYLSFGGGVNSTALLLLMTDEGVDFEAVFVDHGADYPETYAYVAMLQERGFPITVIKPKAYGEFEGLYDYCESSKMVPVRIMRWCTDHFKIRPLYAYFERPAEVLLGIDAGEPHRAKDSRSPDLLNIFPLVDRNIDRAKCVEIIEAHGLPVPKKSGCWFCSFQRRSQWVELNRRYPELWCKALTLEAQNIEWQRDRFQERLLKYEVELRAAMDAPTFRDVYVGPELDDDEPYPDDAEYWTREQVLPRKPVFEPIYLAGRPLAEIIRAKDGRGHYQNDDQGDLFDDRRPCQCGL